MCRASAGWPALSGASALRRCCSPARSSTPTEAQRIGLVGRVVPHEQLLETTLGVAQRIAAAPTARGATDQVRHAPGPRPRLERTRPVGFCHAGPALPNQRPPRRASSHSWKSGPRPTRVPEPASRSVSLWAGAPEPAQLNGRASISALMVEPVAPSPSLMAGPRTEAPPMMASAMSAMSREYSAAVAPSRSRQMRRSSSGRVRALGLPVE